MTSPAWMKRKSNCRRLSPFYKIRIHTAVSAPVYQKEFFWSVPLVPVRPACLSFFDQWLRVHGDVRRLRYRPCPRLVRTSPQIRALNFIDELDALGRAREAFPGMGGNDEKEQALNQLLIGLDSFDPSKEGLVLVAATNRPEILDPSLLRAGRFDRQVLVDRPGRMGRVQILNVHLKKVQLGAYMDAEAVGALTPGFTGADLANLVTEAALLLTRHGGKAIERIIAGLEKKNRLLNPKEREVVAHHEAGHVLVAWALPCSDRIQKVSIIPRRLSRTAAPQRVDDAGDGHRRAWVFTYCL